MQASGLNMLSNDPIQKSLTTSPNYIFNREIEYLPNCSDEVLPGIKWGNYCQLYTPAFWKYLYVQSDLPVNYDSHRLGRTIIEEVVACLLGGYGIPSEMGLLAYDRLKKLDLIHPLVSHRKIYAALSKPFNSNGGKKVFYRFYNQKSNYIFEFLQRSDLSDLENYNDKELRKVLLTIKGIGPKTASWITRNWMKSENVAILDIHILRAGKIAGIFKETDDVSKQYFELENAYINFCKAMDVLPSNMDAIIWSYMKKSSKLAIKIISYSN